MPSVAAVGATSCVLPRRSGFRPQHTRAAFNKTMARPAQAASLAREPCWGALLGALLPAGGYPPAWSSRSRSGGRSRHRGRCAPAPDCLCAPHPPAGRAGGCSAAARRAAAGGGVRGEARGSGSSQAMPPPQQRHRWIAAHPLLRVPCSYWSQGCNDSYPEAQQRQARRQAGRVSHHNSQAAALTGSQPPWCAPAAPSTLGCRQWAASWPPSGCWPRRSPRRSCGRCRCGRSAQTRPEQGAGPWRRATRRGGPGACTGRRTWWRSQEVSDDLTHQRPGEPASARVASPWGESRCRRPAAGGSGGACTSLHPERGGGR